MGREVAKVSFCGGGPLDGDVLSLDIWQQEWKVPIPEAEVDLHDKSKHPKVATVRVHKYERRVFKDPLSGSSFTKMVYVGEGEQ